MPVRSKNTVDRTLSGRLPDLASEGAKSWPQRAGKALIEVLDDAATVLSIVPDPYFDGFELLWNIRHSENYRCPASYQCS